MKKSRKAVGLLCGIGTLFCLGAIVCGYWKLTGSSMNVLTIGTFQNRIVEKYRIPREVNPGDSVDKTVNVKNTGSVPSLIRVKVEKVFGNLDQKGEFHSDDSLSGDQILIQYGKRWWEKKPDGYFYYKGILYPGKTTEEPLFQKYQLSKYAGNEYKGKDARIIVSLESIQADTDPKELWGITAKDLGISVVNGTNGIKTRVGYLGKAGGFQITQSTTDLFSSFKNLTPGCSRTQMIEIENKSSEEVEIFLRAEMPENLNMTDKQRKNVEKFMNSCAQIAVIWGNETIYQGPVSGKGSSYGKNMDQDILLGKFKGKERKDMCVKLTLDPNMETDFSSLTGKVKWIFTAKGEDGNTVTARTEVKTGPKTGDESTWMRWLWMLGAGAYLGAFSIWNKNRMRDTK